MHVRFGTDGVRDVANEALTVELALALGRASVRVFGADRVYVGRDTRLSGPMLEAAVLAGVCAEGAEAVPLGVVPTPAVAHACAGPEAAPASGDALGTGVAAAVMISASHNAFADNGLKLFAPGGRKLSDDEQTEVEKVLDELLDGSVHPGPAGAAVGSIGTHPEAIEAYETSVLDALEGRTLEGLSVVLDCANGSNTTIGPDVLRRLRADVSAIGVAPDGVNINSGCGSTAPATLAEAVVAQGADVGIAFDGDADRLVAVDHLGRVVDGDQLMAMCAIDLKSRGHLRHDAVVVTVMSNLGFRQSMQRHGITVVDTAVGDRYVLEALAEGGYSLGGEQSGHVIFSDLSTTGDGLLSAAMVLDLLVRSGRRLSDLADEAMTRLPQVLVNVQVDRRIPDVADRLSTEIAAVEAELAGEGRVLLRPSGTEPVVRVMAEAPTEDRARALADRLAVAVSALSG